MEKEPPNTVPSPQSAEESAAAAAAKSQKQCRVCESVAHFCNFGVVTCESCKAFFRRNAHKDALLTSCSKDCSLSRENRTPCKSCRLKKCFLVGMDKSLILSPEGKEKRKEKIIQNRLKKEYETRETHGSSDTSSHDSASVTSPVLPYQPSTLSHSSTSQEGDVSMDTTSVDPVECFQDAFLKTISQRFEGTSEPPTGSSGGHTDTSSPSDRLNISPSFSESGSTGERTQGNLRMESITAISDGLSSVSTVDVSQLPGLGTVSPTGGFIKSEPARSTLPPVLRAEVPTSPIPPTPGLQSIPSHHLHSLPPTLVKAEHQTQHSPPQVIKVESQHTQFEHPVIVKSRLTDNGSSNNVLGHPPTLGSIPIPSLSQAEAVSQAGFIRNQSHQIPPHSMGGADPPLRGPQATELHQAQHSSPQQADPMRMEYTSPHTAYTSPPPHPRGDPNMAKRMKIEPARETQKRKLPGYEPEAHSTSFRSNMADKYLQSQRHMADLSLYSTQEGHESLRSKDSPGQSCSPHEYTQQTSPQQSSPQQPSPQQSSPQQPSPQQSSPQQSSPQQPSPQQPSPQQPSPQQSSPQPRLKAGSYSGCVPPASLGLFSPLEAAALTEMMAAFTEAWERPLILSVPLRCDLADAFNLIEGDVRKLVILGRNIGAFSKLSLADQVVLAKGSFFEIALTQSALYFNYETMTIDVNVTGSKEDGRAVTQTDLSSLSRAEASRDCMAEYRLMCKLYTDTTRSDPAITMCLVMSMLFKPRDGFTYEAVDRITRLHHYYIHLLEEYIRIMYPGGEVVFTEVTALYEHINVARTMSEQALEKVPLDQLSIFAKEMFDKNS